MKQNKIYIAITGQIASGKSTFSNLLKEREDEFLILDADDQIKELYKRGAILYDVLVNEFGSLILNEKRNISKKKLREFVLLDDENRERLNALTHPVIIKNMVKLAKESDKSIVFFQIPLLNESIKYLEKLVEIDEVWNIIADDNIRFNRLLQRKNITFDIAKKLISIQSEFENDNYDVLTVENNGSLEELDKKIDLFVKNGVLNDLVDDTFFKKESLEKRKESTESIENTEENNLETEQAHTDFEKENEDIPKPVLITDIEDLNALDKEDDENPYDSFFEEKEDVEKEDIEETKKVKIPSVDDDLEKTKVIDLKNIDLSSFTNEKNNTKENVNEDLQNVFKDEKDPFKTLFDEQENNDLENFKNRSFQVIQNISNDEDVEDDTKKDNKRKKKVKKKMSIFKKIMIAIVSVIVILLFLFLASVAYGGKSYSLNYLEEIEKYSNEYKVNPKVVLAVMKVESDFNPNAQSHTNAKGLMQIMPETSKHVSKLLKLKDSQNLEDPETNIKIGTYYLKYLMNNFHNMDTVYAAYNGGLGNVNTWLKDEKYSKDGVTLDNIPVEETRNYVKKVNKAIKAYEILYGEKFPTKKKKGFSKFIDNTKNTLGYLFRNF